jgi:LacI family transcriptional regulator
MPTMKDVATLAGVSTATVSRALAVGGSGVSLDTRERVLDAVKELDYHPNHLPRNLRRRSSRIFGLVISDIGNPFFTAIARGCEDTAHMHGYRLVLANTDEDAEREASALEVMAAERAGGVMLASTDQATDPIRRLLAVGIPLVALDRRIHGLHVDTVTVDNEAASYDAICHLIALGHARIAMVGGPDTVSTVRERADGYLRALRSHRLDLGDELLRRGDLRESGGYRITVELLSLPAPPTAIFSANNLTTVGVLKALRERGVRVPSDLSLIGFDDLSTGELLDPPLTAVVQPAYQLGARAAELLLRRVENPEAPVQEIVLSAKLTVRGSTGPPPGPEE